jgi:hypothetical protein
VSPHTEKRPWLAALLAFMYPGLGHVYLREWIRALAWFAIAILVAMLVMPTELVEAAETEGLGVLLRTSEFLTFEAITALLAIRMLNAIDAAILALKPTEPTQPTNNCPNCGGELDEDLDFCPWCTRHLDPTEKQ